MRRSSDEITYARAYRRPVLGQGMETRARLHFPSTYTYVTTNPHVLALMYRLGISRAMHRPHQVCMLCSSALFLTLTHWAAKGGKICRARNKKKTSKRTCDSVLWGWGPWVPSPKWYPQGGRNPPNAVHPFFFFPLDIMCKVQWAGVGDWQWLGSMAWGVRAVLLFKPLWERRWQWQVTRALASWAKDLPPSYWAEGPSLHFLEQQVYDHCIILFCPTGSRNPNPIGT